MNLKERCRNMNHGRVNAPIKHCTNCGEIVNVAAVGRCSHSKHLVLRKDRCKYCHDCGKKLSNIE